MISFDKNVLRECHISKSRWEPNLSPVSCPHQFERPNFTTAADSLSLWCN